MNEWQSTKLKNLCEFQEGYVNPSQGVPDYFGDEIKWVRANDLTANYVYDTSRKLSRKGFESAGKSAKLFNPNTIVISKSGTIGRVAIIRDYMCGNRATINIQTNKNADIKFIFYFLKNNREIIEEMAVGSVQKNLYVYILEDMDIYLPPLEEQKSIVSVLSSLDDKIDLLHRQNKTLEALAETVFRKWFVEEAGEDWEEYKVSDLAIHLKTPVVPAKNQLAMYCHYSLPAYDDGVRPVMELGTEILSNKYQVEPWSILVSKLNPRFPRIWPIGDNPGENAVCSTEFQVFKPKQKSLYGYLYFLFRSNDAKEELTMAASGTSGSHQRVRPEDILNIKNNLPSLNLAEKYSEMVMPGIRKVAANLEQIHSLEKLRDSLLPKLMSGEVRVA